MGEHLEADAQVVASGSALQASKPWRQILSDVLSRRVLASSEGEATSLGAAYLLSEHQLTIHRGARPADTAEATGSAEGAVALPPGRICDPDSDAVAAHSAARARQRRLYTQLYS
eukprot:TRINITY_DN6256_c0_g1_i2.p5 TRINITY_DN6256_c0_g1~~TRINITY_DN6256_c0_g1_i2.p5  ORF type:complete len:115 (+),score=41.28 TRINITY_DN6256_c0_g1_i2:1003-1347(+)